MTLTADPAGAVGSPTSGHWAGVASLSVTDVSAGTVADALAQAAAGRTPSLVLVFASSFTDLAVLAEALAGAADGVPVVGVTTAGEIATGHAGSADVVMTVLGGDGLCVSVACATEASAELRSAGATAARALDALAPSPYRTLLLLADGFVGDLQQVVRGAYDVAGAAVPLVGGCAGDDGRMERTHIIVNGTVHTDAIVGVALGSQVPWGVGVAHGWRRVGEPMLVTASEGTTVLSLDDEPALDVYLRHLDAPAEVMHDEAAFSRWAMHHPLGMSRREAEEVRFIAGADFTRRSLQCIAAVPQSGLVWLMEGDSDSVMAATRTACDQALAGLAGRPPVALLAFDCVARRGVLGDEGILREVAAIGSAAPGAAVAGFYTYGEIARTHGTSGFHNQTLVVLAMA